MLSRREFVGAMGAAGGATVVAGASAAPARRKEWRVLDLGSDCMLRESLAGFCRTGIPACPLPTDDHECLSYVVPATARLTDDLLTRLSRHVYEGGWLIFESAAGFGGFEAQREQLARHFHLAIEPPIDLWAGSVPVPYVDYHWPVRTKVRDFSCVIPVHAAAAEIIGTNGQIPVAARLGRLVFVGSPIGPSLLAGDREAHFWFNALLQQMPAPL
jgi:hypothetical protein